MPVIKMFYRRNQYGRKVTRWHYQVKMANYEMLQQYAQNLSET